MFWEYQLTNFKAFAGPEVIPIRPITLLYGANSSGKSSVLQSLLMLKQTIEQAGDRKILLLPQGNLVDLGSYREFVHQHNLAHSFAFKTTFKVAKDELPDSCKELLLAKTEENYLIGLEVRFSYNQSSKNIVFDTVNFLIGDNFDDEVNLVARFKMFEDVLRLDKLNSEHLIWQQWGQLNQKKITQSFSDVLIKFFKEYLASVPRSRKSQRQKIAELLKSEKENLKDAQEKLEKLNLEEEQKAVKDEISKIQEKISKLEALEVLERRFSDYTDQEAIEDYTKVVNDLSTQNFLVGYWQNFDTSSLENNPELDYLYNIFNNVSSESYFFLDDFLKYLNKIFRQLMESIVYIGPLRKSPEKISFSSQISRGQVGKFGENTADILFNKPELLEQVNQCFKEFDIKYQIKVLRLQPPGDSEESIDNVYSLRLRDDRGVSTSFVDVGFGISQVLPIITQNLLGKEQTILIEQPELHLHPKLQTELGDLFLQSALGENKNTLIVETHSEHLLLRIMRRIRETSGGFDPPVKVTPEDVSILFVETINNRTILKKMKLNKYGEFVDSWPGGFFEEDFNELF